MSNLNELKVPDDTDEVTAWAIREEFASRREAYEAHQEFEREGVMGVMKRWRQVLVGVEPEFAYDLRDPKHPRHHEVMADVADLR